MITVSWLVGERERVLLTNSRCVCIWDLDDQRAVPQLPSRIPVLRLGHGGSGSVTPGFLSPCPTPLGHTARACHSGCGEFISMNCFYAVLNFLLSVSGSRNWQPHLTSRSNQRTQRTCLTKCPLFLSPIPRDSCQCFLISWNNLSSLPAA